MSKYKKETSKETIQEAEKLAKANQRPGQTKEQTKLIALGIQKGIEQYKKQQKFKARELDKKLKAVQLKSDQMSKIPDEKTAQNGEISNKASTSKLAWSLLALSWVLFAFYTYSKT